MKMSSKHHMAGTRRGLPCASKLTIEFWRRIFRGIVGWAAILCGSFSAGVVQADAIRVYDWVFGKSTFESQAAAFEKAIAYPVEFHSVDFPISENVEQLLIHNEPIDIVGMFPMAIKRLSEADWLEELSTDKRFSVATEKLYNSVKKAVRAGGGVYGVGQIATGLAVPLIDMDKYQALGLTREDFPVNWQGLNRQLVQAAKAGGRDIYLPYWFDDINGLPLGFTAEVHNRGGTVIDAQTGGLAMNLSSGPAYDTLVDWRELALSGAVDGSVLEMTHGEFISAFYFGEHAVSSHKTDMLILAKEQRTKSRNITLLPRIEQDWGVIGILAFGLIRQPGESEDRNEARRQLLLLNTRGQGDLKFSVAKLWLKQRGNFSVYKDYMESAEAQAILREKLTYPGDVDVLTDVFEHLDYYHGEQGVQWHVEFYNYMKDQLQRYLKSTDVSPAEVIGNLNNKISQLRSLYGYSY